MSRNRPEALQYRPAAAALVAAIEAGGALALARRHADDITGTDALRPRTVYAVLAHELGQSAEAVRREFRRYASGERMCTAPKCLKLVDAASRLGWIPPGALGTPVQDWVAWCHVESEALEQQKTERGERRRMRRRGELAGRVHELVAFAIQSTPPGEFVGDIATLLEDVVDSALSMLLLSERHWPPHAATLLESAASSIRGRVLSTAREIDGRYQRQCEDDEMAMANILEQFHDQGIASARRDRERSRSRPVVVASEERPSELSERALRLGIGRDQLRRILAWMETGEGLSAEDSKRRHELVDAYVDKAKGSLRLQLPAPGQSGATARGKSWSDAKAAIDARRAKDSSGPGSAKRAVKRKAAATKPSR